MSFYRWRCFTSKTGIPSIEGFSRKIHGMRYAATPTTCVGAALRPVPSSIFPIGTILLFVVYILTVPGTCKGQKPCPTITPDNEKRIENYLDALYGTTSGNTAPDQLHYRILSGEDINSSCYKRLVVLEEAHGEKRVFFLTPDQRFLTVALSDTTVNPLQQMLLADNNTASLLLKDDSPSTGDPHSALTMVIFVDLQCPYCRKLDNWLSNLPSDLATKVRIIYKQLPLDMHPWATQGASLAACAFQQGPAAYMEVQHFLFDAQEKLDSSNFTSVSEHLVSQSKVLDSKALDTCLQAKKYRPLLERDQALATALRVTSTPTIFINGHRLRHINSSSEIESQLHGALEQSLGLTLLNTQGSH